MNFFGYKYVSFDIFDTLLIRLVKDPRDVFWLVEKYAKNKQIKIPNQFTELRIKAEKNAKKKKKEYNIYDIYNEIYGFDSEKEKLEVLELEFIAEMDVCVPNKAMIQLYEESIKSKKNVILVSDMYWPERYISRLLLENNINVYKKIYVSCEYGVSKRDGLLFDYLLKDLECTPQEILHYGDNKKSDLVMARKRGIHAKKALYRFPQIYNDDRIYTKEYNTQQKFILGTLDYGQSRYFQLGYMLLGPLLEGVIKWLKKEVDKEKVEQILFFSRDAKIIERAYEILNGKVEHRYIYVSRKALAVPLLWKQENLRDVMKLFAISKHETYRTILHKWGIDPNRYQRMIEDNGVNLEDSININSGKHNLIEKIYKELKVEIDSNSKIQYDNILSYIEEIGLKKKIAIVDIGWFGNMQRAFEKIVKEKDSTITINGFYIALDFGKKTINGKGFLEQKKAIKINKSLTSILEWMFTSSHGSMLGYTKKTDVVECVLDECEFDRNDKKIVDERRIHMEIQEGALQYLNEIKKHPFILNLEKTSEESFGNMKEFIRRPFLLDAKLIGVLRYVGGRGEMEYLAFPKSKLFYIFHIKKMYNDIITAGWIEGFIKQLLSIL